MAKGEDVINLGIGSPDLAPSSMAIEATVRALQDPKNHGYASYRSSPEFRAALSSWYRSVYHVDLDARTQVLPLLGSKEGIHYISTAFLSEGDSVLVPNPGYPTYASTAHLVGANVLYYDLTEKSDWLPDFAQLESMDLKSCKLMWVNYPHMPTGRKATTELFERLIAFGKKHRILICNDNPYSLVLNQDEPLSILAQDPQKETCLEMNSFSKAFNMAGWRIGVVSGHEEVIDCIAQVKSNVDSGMFLPIQIGAIEALKNPKSWHEDRNATYRERREHVWRLFDTLGCTYDKNQQGLFVWAKVPDDVGEVMAYADKILYEARVFLVPGEVFGSNGRRFLRSSLCAEAPRVQEAHRRLSAWKQGSR